MLVPGYEARVRGGQFQGTRPGYEGGTRPGYEGVSSGFNFRIRGYEGTRIY